MDEPVTVYMARGRKNNAELICDCATLGYLRSEWRTLDPTWGTDEGQGRFWKLWRPDVLVASDLYATDPEINRWDFTNLPCENGEFDAVVFDPPYKLNGTGGSHPSDDGYGVGGAYRTWQAKHQLINDGIAECLRVTAKKGMLLVKCQDQVCSGQKRWQTREFAATAEALGCRLVDMLHVPGTRKQPSSTPCLVCTVHPIDDCDRCAGTGRVPRPQKHAQSDYSTLLVLQKGKR